MIVTSRLVVENGNILPYHVAFAGPNRSLDKATQTCCQRTKLTIRPAATGDQQQALTLRVSQFSTIAYSATNSTWLKSRDVNCS